MTAVFSGYSFFDVARGLWSVLFYAHCTTSKYAKQVLHDHFGDASAFYIYYEWYWIRLRKQSHNKIRPKPSLKRSIPHSRKYKGNGYKLSTQRLLGSFVGVGGSGGKRELWLVNSCFEYHRPIITNACTPKRPQKSQRLKVVPILPRVYELGDWPFLPTIGDKMSWETSP